MNNDWSMEERISYFSRQYGAVRAEIARCSGSQFDPRFADIMLQMIDEDAEYTMREV